MKQRFCAPALFVTAAFAATVSFPLLAQEGWAGPRVIGGGMMGGGMMGGGMMGGGMMGGGMMGGGYGSANAYGPQVPEGNGAGARVFQRYCRQCHPLPSPRQHAAGEWPQLVARMKSHMSASGLPRPDDADTKLLIGYLQKYSIATNR